MYIVCCNYLESQGKSFQNRNAPIISTCQTIYVINECGHIFKEQTNATKIFLKTRHYVSKDAEFHSLIKHIDIQHHLIAGILTKSLPSAKVQDIRKKMVVCSFEARGVLVDC